MKKLAFCLPLFLLFLVGCDKDEVPTEPEFNISNIELDLTSTVGEPQEILVTIYKGTPCHYVKEVNTSSSGNTYNYDFILSNEGTEACITVVAEETVSVDFEPSESGEYTLNFYINGEFYQTRTVVVVD